MSRLRGMAGKRKPIGKVTHFYSNISVAVVALTNSLKVGDKISIAKGDNKIEQVVSSMQLEHKQVQSAKKGQEIAIKVASEVKKGAEVYKE